MNGYVTKPVSKLDLYNNLLQWVKSSGGSPRCPSRSSRRPSWACWIWRMPCAGWSMTGGAADPLQAVPLRAQGRSVGHPHRPASPAARSGVPLAAYPEGVSANISASRLQLLAGELEWRLRLQEELSEGSSASCSRSLPRPGRRSPTSCSPGSSRSRSLSRFRPRQAALREGKIAIVLKSPASGYDDPLVRPARAIY